MSPFVRVGFGAAVAAFALLALAGCGQGERERVEQARQSVRAWAATVEMAAEHSGRGAVPDHYVAQIGKAAGEQLEKQRKLLDQLPADDVERNAVYAELTRAQEKAKVMEDAASGGRRS
jgi:hypothetical protein